MSRVALAGGYVHAMSFHRCYRLALDLELREPVTVLVSVDIHGAVY